MQIESKRLTLKQQIQVLERAKIELFEDDCRRGLCWQISKSLAHYNHYCKGYNDLERCIPLFTYENANFYGKTDKRIEKPRDTRIVPTDRGSYWWRSYDRKSREAFLDCMICEIKQADDGLKPLPSAAEMIDEKMIEMNHKLAKFRETTNNIILMDPIDVGPVSTEDEIRNLQSIGRVERSGNTPEIVSLVKEYACDNCKKYPCSIGDWEDRMEKKEVGKCGDQSKVF